MLDILTGLDKLILFSLPLANGVTVFPGAMVTVDANGKVILATANSKPWYLCISDSQEPMVKAAGTVGLILGDVRYKTDNFDTGSSYPVGTPLTLAAGGKLKPAGATDVIVGYIEQIVSSNPTLVAIVRGF